MEHLFQIASFTDCGTFCATVCKSFQFRHEYTLILIQRCTASGLENRWPPANSSSASYSRKTFFWRRHGIDEGIEQDPGLKWVRSVENVPQLKKKKTTIENVTLCRKKKSKNYFNWQKNNNKQIRICGKNWRALRASLMCQRVQKYIYSSLLWKKTPKVSAIDYYHRMRYICLCAFLRIAY